MSCHYFDIYPLDELSKGTVVLNILLKLLYVGNVETHRVSLTSFASDTIGIGTRFRASINLGVYDKVYRAFPMEGRRKE